MDKLQEIRNKIASLVDEFSAIQYEPKAFIPGSTIVPPSGKVIDAAELKNMVDASLDGWLTTGRFNSAFEKRLAEYMGVKFLISTNSTHLLLVNYKTDWVGGCLVFSRHFYGLCGLNLNSQFRNLLFQVGAFIHAFNIQRFCFSKLFISIGNVF